MTTTMLQLFSYSVETITNFRLCKTAFKTIFFETKNVLGSTNVSKARSTALNFPHNNVVIVIVSNCKYANTKATRTHFSRLCTARTLLYQGASVKGGLSQVDPWPLGRDTPLEGTWDQRQRPPEGTWDQSLRPPRENMGPGSHTGNYIIQRSPLWTDWQTCVKTLPCSKLCLRVVTTLQ